MNNIILSVVFGVDQEQMIIALLNEQIGVEEFHHEKTEELGDDLVRFKITFSNAYAVYWFGYQQAKMITKFTG